MNSYYKGFRPKSLKFLDTTHITTRLLHHQLFFKFKTSQLLQQGNYMHPAYYYPFNSTFNIQILQTDFVHSPIYLFTQLCQFLAMSPQWCVGLRQLLQAHNSPFSHDKESRVRLVIFVLNLPDWQVLLFGGNSYYRRFVINPANQKGLWGLVEMTCGLVPASYSLPEWQAVKLTFFAPCTEFICARVGRQGLRFIVII